jgi:membrane protease subunit (stomatin/prohibitin family)
MFGAGAGAAGGLVNPVQPWAPPGQQGAPQQQAAPEGQQAAPAAAPASEDPVAKLAQYKQMLEQGLISEEDYEAAKKAALGL